LLDKRFGHRALLGGLILPLLVAGMVINNRRLVWVEVAAGLALVFVLAPSTRRKRAIVRGAAIASPFVAAYSVVGWSSSALIFRPVEIVRSMVDSSTDGSTSWRDWENYDLFCTIKAHPLTGTGYGHGYIEVVKLPDISEMYALYRFIPHNGILGLFAYGGIIGFTALSTVFVVGIFFAARAQRYATAPEDRLAALGALTMIVIYLVHCYGDMGLGTWAGVFTVAPALAVAAKLAVSTGAWRDPVARQVTADSVLA
jgi:O-antigen ligase